MILGDNAILDGIIDGRITITPFDVRNLGPNSYDVHLGPTLAVPKFPQLACNAECPVEYEAIPKDGYNLLPGCLYLAVTVEYTETRGFVPYLDGKSSVGRLGLSVHATAGRGDDGFCGHWTMEISVVQPLVVFAGMPIGQITYHRTTGSSVDYGQREASSYREQRGWTSDPKPVPSRLWRHRFFTQGVK